MTWNGWAGRNASARRVSAAVIGVAVLGAAQVAYGEFYVWQEADGTRHVSTHPRECFRGYPLPSETCAPIQADPELKRRLKAERRAREAEKEAQQFRRECVALQNKREKLSTAISRTQSEFSQRAMTLTLGLGEILTAPVAVKSLWEEMLAVDRELDKCYRADQRPKRREARNWMRRQTAQNARVAGQQNLLRDIRSELSEIKGDLRFR